MIKDTSTNGTFINGVKVNSPAGRSMPLPWRLPDLALIAQPCFLAKALQLLGAMPPGFALFAVRLSYYVTLPCPAPPAPHPPKQVGKGNTGVAFPGDRVQLSVADAKAPQSHME